MKLNKLYKRIIKFLTKNNEEKKQLIKIKLQNEQDIYYYLNKNTNLQNLLIQEQTKNIELRIKISELERKQRYINAKEVLADFVKEIKEMQK